MTGTGAEEMWRGSEKKYSIQRGVSKKFLILERGSENFLCPSNSQKSHVRESTLIRFHPIVPSFES